MAFALKPQILAAFLLIACSARVHGETFVLPLSLHEQTATNGSFATANFDFGTTFSQVNSVTLQLLIPGGYQGLAVSTGNSSDWGWLDTALYGPQTNLDQLCFCTFGLPMPAGLGQAAFSVPANKMSDIDLTPQDFSYVGQAVWPDFILDGKGKLVIFADTEFTSGLLSGTTPTTTTTWWVPSGTQAVSLTIVATPVPEPTSILLLAVGLAWLGLPRSR